MVSGVQSWASLGLGRTGRTRLGGPRRLRGRREELHKLANQTSKPHKQIHQFCVLPCSSTPVQFSLTSRANTPKCDSRQHGAPLGAETKRRDANTPKCDSRTQNQPLGAQDATRIPRSATEHEPQRAARRDSSDANTPKSDDKSRRDLSPVELRPRQGVSVRSSTD